MKKLLLFFSLIFVFSFSAFADKDFSDLDKMYTFCKHEREVKLANGKIRIIDEYGYQEINEKSTKGFCNYYLEYGDRRPDLIPNTYEELRANDFCYYSNIYTTTCNKMFDNLPDDLPELDNNTEIDSINENSLYISEPETVTNQEMDNENTIDISEPETATNQEMEEDSNASDIMKKLQELKSMLDAGLISQEDYDKKKDKYLKDY